MSDERKLTEEDREKIQRLMESGTLENVTLALSLIEETAGQEDIAEIFTMNVIVELICINGPESLDAMVRAGQFIRRCPETWKRFSEAVVGPDQNGVGPHVLTSQRYVVMVSKIDLVRGLWPSKSVSINHLLDGFTLISSGAAEQLLRDEDEVWYEDLSLGGLTFISDVVAKILSKHKEGDLCLDGLTDLSDAAAESLSKHNGDLHLNGLKSIPSEKGHTALLNKLCQ
ncbi:MAG: hypothetical protein NZ577_04015, partial [Vicinamibacterales bacterium]|nr:hypothetical protein [Vicinamibacterales bacterium]